MTNEWPENFFSKNFPIDILYIQYSTFFGKSTIGIDVGPYTQSINLIFQLIDKDQDSKISIEEISELKKIIELMQ